MRLRILLVLTTFCLCASDIKTAETRTSSTFQDNSQDLEFLAILENGIQLAGLSLEEHTFINHIKDYRLKVEKYGYSLSDQDKQFLEIEFVNFLNLWGHN